MLAKNSIHEVFLKIIAIYYPLKSYYLKPSKNGDSIVNVVIA